VNPLSNKITLFFQFIVTLKKKLIKKKKPKKKPKINKTNKKLKQANLYINYNKAKKIN
jgi:hypothetical protein